MRPPEPEPIASSQTNNASRSLVPSVVKRYWRWIGAVILLIIIAVVVAFFVWRHYHHKTNLVDNTKAPTNQELAAGSNKDAEKALSKKDYQTAAQQYLSAAAADSAAKNYQKAEADLQTAIAKIPDRYIPYTIYDTLYGVAKAMNNKSLEISSLQKALVKASQPDSGAPAGLTDFYHQLLKGLGQK